MPLTIYIITGLILIGLVAVIYYLRELKSSRVDDPSFRMMQDWMREVREQTERTRKEIQDRLESNQDFTSKRLDRTHKEIGDRLDNAARIIGKVQRELGSMSEIGRQMQSLQDFLQSPKLRGNIGEQVLRDLLAQGLPHEHYHIQYSFRGGAVVDALIQTDQGSIPIDSKFPRENFQKMLSAETEQERSEARKMFINDVRKHIRDIASKYILPDEGTLDFAIMYIPSEAIAYEVTVTIPELIEYAQEHRVVPISPNQFNYFLRVIMLGLEGKRVEKRAEQILQGLKRLHGEMQRFGSEFDILMSHVTNAKNKADVVAGRYAQLRGKLESLQQLETTEPPSLPIEDD